MLQNEEQVTRISSPEKVARLLEKVAQNGLPLVLRALSSPATAIKGRATPSNAPISQVGFKIGNVSERGLQFLLMHAAGGIQVEFVLAAAKVIFSTAVINVSRQDCSVQLPSVLISIERRKDARYTVSGNARCFFSTKLWQPDERDLGGVPFFESSRELAALIPIGDVSLGGCSIVTQFPSIAKNFDRGQLINIGQLHLPLSAPLNVSVSVRWCKRMKEVVKDLDGFNRIIRTYRVGLQLMEPSEDVLRNLQVFIQRISSADAI